MVVGYKLGELVGEGKVFVNGKFNQQGVEDIVKDGAKTIALGKLPFRQQIGYGLAIDYAYEVNKYNATDQSIKTEMLGSVAGSSAQISSEVFMPKFSGIGKIITNTIASDVISDKTKDKYNEHLNENKSKEAK
ncbi:hypothetical protein [Bibersteinia trehalosi]|uniref:hypothetical protein n=1 Tax=Bibersteinia trehalosi TaxID=47735 RepID=UPI002D774D40|nr:hypothetical protein [Bibersteinia trehalosi]